jgi:hypothetical protein
MAFATVWRATRQLRFVCDSFAGDDRAHERDEQEIPDHVVDVAARRVKVLSARLFRRYPK